MPKQYYIVTKKHEALWPRKRSGNNRSMVGVMLFWAANSSGYSSTLENAGKYTEKEARDICCLRGEDYAIPCELIESVDIDKLDAILSHVNGAALAQEKIPREA